MKDKIISFLIGLFIGITITSFYHFYFNKSDKKKLSNQEMSRAQEITPERLQEMSERLGISKKELQKELDSGKDFRVIMQERGIEGGFQRGGRREFNQE